MKLMSKKQSMLTPSKTNYHKEGTGNSDDQHWVLLEEDKERAKKLSLGSKCVTNWSD